MPKKKRPKYFKRFRKKRHPFHTILIVFATVMIWWGTWRILDHFLFHNTFLSGIGAIILGLLILFIDDFKISELEK